MNGITVIAGENNTGKSTFGKVLYCIFNAFHDSETAIRNERINSIRRILRNYIRLLNLRSIPKSMIEELLSTDDIRGKIVDIINTIDKISIDDSTIDKLQENIERFISIGNEEIQKMLITRFLRLEFAGKVNHINKSGDVGKITLKIKGKTIETTIKSDECTNYSDAIGIIYDAIYFDTPFVMDNLRSYNRFPDSYNMNNHRNDIFERLCRKSIDITLLEEAIIKQKINNILLNINSVVAGEFKEEEEGIFFKENNMQKPLPIQNISTGLKTFLIIKRLLEMGHIKDRGILILDEPEIHLHPDWQVRFAEMLVLLQKEFDLSILLTTHSPYFLHAIEIFSGKYNLRKQLTCYLAESKKDISVIRNVTDNIDAIYKQLAQPFQTLEDIRYND